MEENPVNTKQNQATFFSEHVIINPNAIHSSHFVGEKSDKPIGFLCSCMLLRHTISYHCVHQLSDKHLDQYNSVLTVLMNNTSTISKKHKEQINNYSMDVLMSALDD
jgi:hypothetical protein